MKTPKALPIPSSAGVNNLPEVLIIPELEQVADVEDNLRPERKYLTKSERAQIAYYYGTKKIKAAILARHFGVNVQTIRNIAAMEAI